MTYVKPPFYKSSVFWTHLAVLSGSAATGVTGILDKSFLTNHPIIDAVIIASAAIAASVSQFAYSIAMGMKAQAQASATVAPANTFVA